MWVLGHSCITPIKLELSQPDNVDSSEMQEGVRMSKGGGCSQNTSLSGFSVSIICKQAASSINRPAGKQKAVEVMASLLPGTQETTSILMY